VDLQGAELAVAVTSPDRSTVTIRPSRSLLGRGVRDLWPYRELAYFLVWRDVKVRYKQTVLGASWAVIQPFMLMIIFSVVFGHFAKLPSDGVPYPVFTYTALVPWTLFASGLVAASTSLVSNANLVSKVYFPRLLLPLGAVLGCVVDFCIAFLIIGVMMVYYGVSPSIGIVLIPALILLTLVTALGVGTWLAALNVRYRDFQYVVPFLVQIWLFATPVAYASRIFPHSIQVILGFNPMVGVVDGFRWGLIGTPAPPWGSLALSTGVAFLGLIAGLMYFQRVERSFADII
jgi:lipopolysaccharide transport system permease protein